MPRSLNRVTLLGHLGADAENKYTASGVAVSTFHLATERRWKDQKLGEYRTETDWHRVVMWHSDHVQTYLTKGRAVLIEGRLQSRSYEDRNGVKRYVTEVVVENLILLAAGGGESTRQAQPQEAPGTPGSGQAIDDDAPF